MADKAIFLDRDDTIIEDSGYINSPQQVKLMPTAAAALVELRRMGYKLIVVSNQSGIARGIFTEQTLTQIHERLKLLLAEHNAYLDRIYYCPYHPEGAIEKYRRDSDWRKPKPGMLLAASKEMKIDLKKSWMIGNDYRDIQAGKSAGCKTILVKSYTKTVLKQKNDPEPDFEAINLREAVNIIKRETSQKAAAAAPKAAETSRQTEEKKIASQEIPTVAPAAAEKQIAPQQPSEPEKTQVSEIQITEQKPAEEKPAIEEKPIEAAVCTKEETPDFTQPPQQAESAQAESTEDKPTAEDKKEKLIAVETGSKTESLLEDIKLLLQSRNRTEQYTEFSAIKFTAGVLQTLVFFCLIVAIWYKLSPTARDSNVFSAIGFAIVLQLMSLTFFIMHKDR